MALALPLMVQVDQPHSGQRGVRLGALAQHELAVGALLGAMPGLHGRRGGAQHDADLQLVGAPDGQVARRVAQPFLLLV
ncbi:hypothetical protein D3C87_1845830 [compost metagenome]